MHLRTFPSRKGMEYYRLSFPFIPAYVRSLFTTSHESSYHRPRYCRQLPGMGAETARSGFYDCRPSHCGNGIPRSRRTGESADRPRLPARVAAGGVFFRPFLFYPETERELGGSWWQKTPIFRELETEDQLEIWQERQTAPESCSYAGPLFPWPEHWEGKGQAAYTARSGVLHVETMVNAMRRFFLGRGPVCRSGGGSRRYSAGCRRLFHWCGDSFHILWCTGWEAGMHPDMAPPEGQAIQGNDSGSGAEGSGMARRHSAFRALAGSQRIFLAVRRHVRLGLGCPGRSGSASRPGTDAGHG